MNQLRKKVEIGGLYEMSERKKLLFIGDSITEWGRFQDPENLGNNYVRLIHDYLKVSYPNKNFEVINRGISGNRITDLEKRWGEDVVGHNPDILSISIGINDVWRQIDQPQMEQVYPEQFRIIYEKLIVDTKEKTNAKIILLEPTVIEEVVSKKANDMLKPYVEIVRGLAKKYNTAIVPMHDLFLQYLQKGDYPVTTDGVHMNSAGNMLMALGWLKVAEEIFVSTI